jgi:hypothetical protein
MPFGNLQSPCVPLAQPVQQPAAGGVGGGVGTDGAGVGGAVGGGVGGAVGGGGVGGAVGGGATHDFTHAANVIVPPVSSRQAPVFFAQVYMVAGGGVGGCGGGVGTSGQQSTASPAHLCCSKGYGPHVPGQPTLGSLHGPCEPSGQLAQPEEPSAAQR